MAGGAFDDCGTIALAGAGTRLAGRQSLAAFDFEDGSLVLTEAGTKRRASLHVVRGRRDCARLILGGLRFLGAIWRRFERRLRRRIGR